MVLSHEIEGSNPFGATNNEAENYLCGGFPLSSYLGFNYHFTRESEREAASNAPPRLPNLEHLLVDELCMYSAHPVSNAAVFSES